MAKFLFILSLTFTILISFFQSTMTKELFTETNESIQSKLEWLNSKSEEITNGLIEFKYSETKGFHCIAKKNVSRGENVFNIPKQYLISNCKFISSN